MLLFGTVLVYYLIPGTCRWPVLLAASLIFYAAAGKECMGYLLFSAAVTWIGGILMGRVKAWKKKAVLAGALLLNLGLLCSLKYEGFLSAEAGIHLPWGSVLLPLGISFYVFQTTAYLVDTFRGTVSPEKNPLKYLLFVSFFPQIVQGPIGRWNRLAPQLFRKNSFSLENLESGICRMVWGFFKTMVIGDWAAVFVNTVYGDPDTCRGLILAAVLLYSIQLYANFSGGIDIVVGVAKLFGIHLDENFRQPYFSASVGEFWRRWHMTLGSWLKDYVYIPLGGSRRGTFRTYGNLILTFLISGIWHGAGLTFVIWGVIHGVYQVLGKAFGKQKNQIYDRWQLSGKTWFLWWKRIVNFLLISFAWIFFRADSVEHAFRIIRGLFCRPEFSALLTIPAGRDGLQGTTMALCALAGGMLLLFLHSLWQEHHPGAEVLELTDHPVLRFTVVLVLLLFIGVFGCTAQAGGFIYAQF